MKLHKLYNTTLKSDFIILHCYENEKFAFKKEDVVELDFVNYHSDSNEKGKWQQILDKSELQTLIKLKFFLFWIATPYFLLIFTADFERGVVFAFMVTSIFILTFLYHLTKIVRISLSSSTYEEDNTYGKISHILQILDSKNNKYFFDVLINDSFCLKELLDFFDYQLTSVKSQGIGIETKTNENSQELRYCFNYNFSFKSYGLDYFNSLIFGFFYYALIFSFCFAETYLISDPWVRFPVYAIIIPFIISMFLLRVLSIGIYKKIKRKTFFNTAKGLIGSKDTALVITYSKGYNRIGVDRPYFPGDEEADDFDNIRFELKNWAHREELFFEGNLEYNVAPFRLKIITNDDFFEVWWLKNFGKGGEINEQEGHKSYYLDNKFYDKFGIESASVDLYNNEKLFSLRNKYLEKISD